MTVRRISRNKEEYTGLAADTKPPNVPEGSTFYATDTDTTYVCIGASWVLEPGLTSGGGGGIGSGSGPGTGTVTSLNDAASSVTLLAANPSRQGAIIVNDSTSILYVKLGATASLTSFSYRLNPDDILELPLPVYTGIIDGIWSADASGAARITELTA